MQLLLDGLLCTFIPIKTFRAEHNLPPSFGVAYYEPKDFDGLAAIDSAGADMTRLRAYMLNAIPQRIPLSDLLTVVEHLQETFDEQLLAINANINLKPQEIDFAVAGFGDVLRRWAYALVAAAAGGDKRPFSMIYGMWLSDSARISSEIHELEHGGDTWQIQVVSYVYGRVGLRVTTPDAVYYVVDSVYTCPAEGFMAGLTSELAARLAQALA